MARLSLIGKASLLLGVLAISTVAAAATESAEAQHEKAVALAREGHHARSLSLLNYLLAQDPQNYSMRRDYIIISTWVDQCDAALKHYEVIKNSPAQEPYLILPVAECMERGGASESAVKLLDDTYKRTGDEEVKEAWQGATKRLVDSRRFTLEGSLGTAKSELGAREWFLGLRLSRKVDDTWSWYTRFWHVRADDRSFGSGDLHRLGAGVTYAFNRHFSVIQDFAVDATHMNEFGSTTTLVISPNVLWQGRLEYASFAEDVPLRGKAVDITAKRFSGSVDFHTQNYQWEWNASFARYDFTDDNARNSLGSSIAYAFELKPKREQRMILGFYRSTNSLDSAVYYNPERDFSSMLTYRLDVVRESHFPRLVDHIYVYIGPYAQRNYDAMPIYGVRYEQDYDLNDLTALNWGAAWRSSVYDGQRETEANVSILVRRKL